MNVTKLLTMTALAISPMSFAVSTIPVQAAAMTVASCQPLSGDNLDECCAAENWRDLILSADVRFCPKLNDSDRDSGRMGDEMPAGRTVDGGGTVGGGGTGNNGGGGNNGGPDTTGGIGNPGMGNPGTGVDKPVGNAGEQDKGDTDNPSGTKGNSN